MSQNTTKETLANKRQAMFRIRFRFCMDNEI